VIETLTLDLQNEKIENEKIKSQLGDGKEHYETELKKKDEEF
jgi:hypothetical protein